VLGARLNPVNLRMGRIAISGKMLQVDIDEINPKFKQAELYIKSDIKAFLSLANHEIRSLNNFKKHTSSRIYDAYKNTYSEFIAQEFANIRKNPTLLTAHKFLLALSEFLEIKDATLFTDSIWLPFSHLLPRAKTPRSFFSMRSFGCLGFALPAALGACMAAPRRKIISLSGDGAFLFNCQELSTAATYGLKNFIQIVFDNNGYSSLHDLARSKFTRQGSYYLWSIIDYQRFSESLGVKAITVDSPTKISAALKKAFNGKGPYLINVITASQDIFKGAFLVKK
jgi:thiamine pyrophosphate-dependent acetolactate synthase large subunit-like protein